MRNNPFERYDLDPRLGPAEITRRLRELAEEAPESERAELQAAWEELTLHPRRRLHAALWAHPETRAPLGAAPSVRRRAPAPMTERDLEERPRVVLGAAEALLDPPSLDHDPHLQGGTS
jgi:hypothetical protein